MLSFDPIELAIDVTVWAIAVSTVIGLVVLLRKLARKVLLGDSDKEHAECLARGDELGDQIDHLQKSLHVVQIEVAILRDRTDRRLHPSQKEGKK